MVIFRSAGESIRPDDGAGRAVRTSKVRDSLTRLRAVNNARTEEENTFIFHIFQLGKTYHFIMQNIARQFAVEE